MPAFIRDVSRLAASFEAADGVTRPGRHFEAGALRLRRLSGGARMEAVIVNTGGGIAGGDRHEIAVTLADGAAATVTSQAAEKIYRADSVPARISVQLDVGRQARLGWLPQETILYDGARIERRLGADVAADATLTWGEMLVFGRLAHGEAMTSGGVRDRWRIRRGGNLAFAEELQLDAASGLLDRPALGGGARAVATLVHVAPDSAERLAGVRDALAGAACEGGASAWNGILVCRLAGADPAAVRSAVAKALEAITGEILPRSWNC